MAQLPGQQIDGGRAAEPRAALLPHGDHRRSVASRTAGLRKNRMEEKPISREEYIDKVLSAYRRTPGTAGTIRRPDRLLAAQLHERGVALMAVENALVLAGARRLVRAAGRPAPPPPC